MQIFLNRGKAKGLVMTPDIANKKLSKVQQAVIRQMRNGSVIGEFSDKMNGRYELITRNPNETHYSNRFKVKRINKNTVFALLALGLIRKDDTVAKAMLPFGRDIWYVFEANR